MTKTIKLILFSLFFLLSLLLSTCQLFAMKIDTATIKAGTAKIIGRVTSLESTSKNKVGVNITVLHPISGEYVQYNTFTNQSGEFALDVDVETAISQISLYTSLNPEKSLLVRLTSGGITRIDIAYNSNFDIKNIEVVPTMNQNDITGGLAIIDKMIAYKSGRIPVSLYNKSTDDYLNYAKTILSERLTILNNDTLLSAELKEILAKDFHLFLYSTHIFPYESEMIRNYHNMNKGKNKKPVIQKVDRSYFCFLRDFNFNDPQYLYCYTFPEVQKEILRNEIIGLPEIGESDIPSWLAKVKTILSDLVGFDSGQYYDILAANAYGRQLNEEVRPLSEQQKRNIESYWKDGEITKILFRKNQKAMALDKFKSPRVVHDISSVPVDKVIETILTKYKDKVIFIDFWATWCSPCLQAIEQFRATKNEFHGKDIIFVYLTNGSSPRKLWEEKIKGIGSEHYYLNSEQWEYMMEHFDFEAIPSYLLYDKGGVLKNKFTAFPGSDKVKKMITDIM